MGRRNVRQEEEACLEAVIKQAGPLDYPSSPVDFEQALTHLASGDSNEKEAAEKLLRKNYDYAIFANKKIEKLWRLFWDTNASTHQFLSFLGVNICKGNRILSLQQRMGEYKSVVENLLLDQKTQESITISRLAVLQNQLNSLRNNNFKTHMMALFGGALLFRLFYGG